MKNSVLIALTLGSILMFGATGCHKKAVDPTNIPGRTRVGGTGLESGLPGGTGLNGSQDGTALNNPTTDENGLTPFGTNTVIDTILGGEHDTDRNIFAQDVVYFDTDSASIKASEQSKLERIASVMKEKDATSTGLVIEGYCDERGTEGYNLALGDRRSLAIREYLITLGVESGRMMTKSFGEANPVNEDHNEAAWSQNRRGFSVLVSKKQ